MTDKKAIEGAYKPPTERTNLQATDAASNAPATTPDAHASEDASDSSRRPGSGVDGFLAEAVTPARNHFTSTADIMAAAREWTDDRDEHRFGSRALAKALRERGVKKHSNGQRRGWRGVKLR